MSVLYALLLILVPQQAATDVAKALAEASALYEKNENAKALAAYDRVVALDAANPEGHLGRGRTLARIRKYEDAIAAFSEAIRLRPDDALALRDRGHYYINLHRLEPALADLTRAESLTRNDYGIYYHLALACYLTGDFARAVAAYEGCVRTAPTAENRVACHGWQVPALLRAGRNGDAQKALDTALALQVKPETAYLDRLQLLKGTLTEEAAAKTMGKGGLELATVGYSIGVWHLVNGRPDRARTYFEKSAASEASYAFGAVASAMELKRLRKD